MPDLRAILTVEYDTFCHCLSGAKQGDRATGIATRATIRPLPGITGR